MENGSTIDVPKVRGIGGLLALGTCNTCGLSFSSGKGIALHAEVDCSKEDRNKNCGVIQVGPITL
jgi:hypothetical protein